MNKYWIIGTSIDKYIDDFIKLVSVVSTGDEFTVDFSDEGEPSIEFDGQKLLAYRSEIVLRQMIDSWMGLGLIRSSMSGYRVLFDQPDVDKITRFSKIFLFDVSENERVNNFRFSRQIDILVINDIINDFDLPNNNISQSRGKLTISKIRKSISNYEKNIAIDSELIEKARCKNVK